MNYRAYRVHETAAGLAGKVEQLCRTDPLAGQVLIRAQYSSVNYKDALAATGRNKLIRAFPRVPGIDVAGVVEKSGDARFDAGQAVLVTGYDFGIGVDGGFAELVTAPADWVVPLPAGMSTREAMMLGTAGFTVGLCVMRLEENGQTPAGGPVVVTGATGGVGSIAIDVLSAKGYEVVALTGKMAAADYLKSLGTAQVLERTAVDCNAPPLAKAQWGGAIDNVGGEALAWLTKTVRPWGNICSVGLAASPELHTTVMPFILRGVSLLGITSSGCPEPRRSRIWARLASDLRPRHLQRIVSREVGLEGLEAVFANMLAGTIQGRTLVKL